MYRVLFCLLWFSTGVFAQQGIQWEKDLSEALSKGKSTGKLVFVEAYLPTCPACKAMDPQFQNAEVAKFYNQNFINYKMNLSIEGARGFLDERKIEIPSFPQFLFFNGEGELVHQGETVPTPAGVLSIGNEARDPSLWSSNFIKQFEQGNREFDFLIKYGNYARVSRDMAASKKITDAIWENFNREEIGSNLSWQITKKVVNDTDNEFFRYWIDHMAEAAALEKAEGHEGQEVQVLGRILQQTIFSPESKMFPIEKVNQLEQYMGKVGAGMYADAFLWEHRVRAYLRDGMKATALQEGEKAVELYKQNGAAMLYVVQVFTSHVPEFVPLTLTWLQRAFPMLKENNYLAEYYYQMSVVSRKRGNVEESKQFADQALEKAKLAELQLDKFIIQASQD
jgi:thiol-disulfide isomerase/thioredoxin